MTNPNDPFNRPTDPFGRPIPPDQPAEGYYTSNPYEAYGEAPPNATTAYPTYGYDPNYDPNQQQPPHNPTQAFPTYQGGQGYPGEVRPLEQMPSGKPKKTGMWIAIAGAVALVLVGGIAIALLSGNSDDSTSATGTSTRAAPVTPPIQPKSGTKLPPTTGSVPSGLPGIIEGLGAAMGTISANDGSTLTIDGFDGKPVTVHTTPETQVVSLTGSKVSDLKVGDTVVVQGEAVGDGSIDAKVIVSTSLDLGGFGR